MKCSVFIATSVDGFIADERGQVDWLHQVGKQGVDLGEKKDMGFAAHIASVDCMIMGRKCMETLDGFQLTPEQWPYGDTRIIVLSNTVKEVPESLKGRVEMYSGGVSELVTQLESEGYQHAYIDGGVTIQAFLNLKLINEMCITLAPVLLGKGRPLFGEVFANIHLTDAKATAYANDFVQLTYQVAYP